MDKNKRLCLKCNGYIPTTITIDGKWRNLKNRRYCLTCVPFGTTSRQHQVNSLPPLERKRKRNAQATKNQKAMRRRNKKKLVAFLGGKCIKCGYNTCVGSLDFHHRNPADKKFSISSHGLHRDWVQLAEEALKCDLLCKNCHGEHHYKE